MKRWHAIALLMGLLTLAAAGDAWYARAITGGGGGGGGGAGLTAVSTDASLTGNGTAGSPLALATPVPVAAGGTNAATAAAARASLASAALVTCAAHNFASVLGAAASTCAQPAASDVTGLATVATSGSASDLGAGTLAAARLPNPSASTLGGTQSIAAVAHNFLTSISTAGVPGQAQPAASDISGLATVATSGSASDLATGTLPSARIAPLPNFSPAASGTTLANQVMVANQTLLYGFVLSVPVQLTHFVYNVNTADNSNFSDVGIYGPCTAGQSCALAFDVGQFKSATTGYVAGTIITNAACTASGVPSVCCTGSGTGTCPSTPITLAPGLYFEGATSTTTTFGIPTTNNGNIYNYFGKYTSQGATSNGILAASITAPSSISGTVNAQPLIALTP